MDFELSEDQELLREAARELLDDYASADRVRAVMEADTAAGAADEALWKALIEQGWLGVEVPEDRGGLGMGFVEGAVLLEEVGRHAAPAPFPQSLLAGWALRDTPWAERLLNGAVAAVGWAEGADRVLMPYAPVADVAVIATDEALLVCDLDLVGRPAAEPAMDRTRPMGWLPVGGAGFTRIGGPAEAAAFISRGATASAAEALGGADRVLAMTVQYAKDRVQFGQPIGSFQAIKHRCADMLVDVEGMRSTVYHAAWSISAGDPDADIAASTAKVWCGDASRRVMESALQVHGGIGFTWEHDLHIYLKRAQLDQLLFGRAQAHRERLAALLRPKVAAGSSIF
jgi:alkylation response protein AidB-like acyl-CoA dehydrogenase